MLTLQSLLVSMELYLNNCRMPAILQMNGHYSSEVVADQLKVKGLAVKSQLKQILPA